MPSRQLRPATPEERHFLERMHQSTSDWSTDLTGGGCAALFILIAGVVASKYLGLLRGMEYWYVLLGFGVGGFMVYRLRQGLAELRRTAARDRYLPVEETVYEISETICVEEFEDTGSSYFLKLVNGEVVFLRGQYLYEFEDTHRFPCSRLTMVRTSVAKTLIQVTCTGDYIQPLATLPPFSEEYRQKEKCPVDGEVLAVSFESLLP